MKESNRIKKLVPGFLFPLIFLIPIVISIYILQNHFSATFIICAITLVQMFVAGTNLKYFFASAFVGIIGVLGFLLKTSTSGGADGFRTSRIQTWLHLDEANLTGDAWQITQSLYAIGSGGLFGLGLGNSRQKYLYLPEPQNDFIFAVLAEELGFFGCILVIFLFVLFVWRGIVIAIKAEDNFGTLIAILNLRLLAITINKTVSMPSTKAQIYSSSQYLIRMAIMAVVLFVSAKAPHLNIIGTAIGLLSTKFVILTQKLLIEKVKRKEA